jgi:hypothetical protein
VTTFVKQAYVAGALGALALCMLLAVAVRKLWGRKSCFASSGGRQSSRRDSLNNFRSDLDQRPIGARRNSSVRRMGSPLDVAMVNGEPLRIKSTCPQPEHAGLLVRAVGGTRGRPQVELIGAPEGAAAGFEIDKRHLQRARLPASADADNEGRMAWQERFGGANVGGANV